MKTVEWSMAFWTHISKSINIMTDDGDVNHKTTRRFYEAQKQSSIETDTGTS
jgi:hypothetical protein